MRDELRRDAAPRSAADTSVSVVVLTGAGRGFCSGIDVRDFGPGMLNAADPAIDRLRFQETMAALPQAIRDAAAAGDRRGQRSVRRARAWRCAWPPTSASARPQPRSATPRSCSGLSGAEMGMSYHLPRIVGTSVAADWMLTGRTVTADEADRRGLVSQLVDTRRGCSTMRSNSPAVSPAWRRWASS